MASNSIKQIPYGPTYMPFAWLLEVKYMKRDEPDSRIAALKDEARTQLLRYASDKPITLSHGSAKLRLITVVFRGWEIANMEEICIKSE